MESFIFCAVQNIHWYHCTKMKFPNKVFLNKSAVSCGFDHIFWIHSYWKLHLCSELEFQASLSELFDVIKLHFLYQIFSPVLIKDLKRTPHLAKNPFEVLNNILKLGQVGNLKLGINLSNKLLLEIRKFMCNYFLLI